MTPNDMTNQKLMSAHSIIPVTIACSCQHPDHRQLRLSSLQHREKKKKESVRIEKVETK